MPPASYMTAAQAVYQPQEQAEASSLQTTDTTTKATLEAEKPQVQTDYESAIDTLTQKVQDQTAQINQLYSQRLGGNFSGLQGNDMGQMFARANEQQSIISQTEANKLSQITTEEGNADTTYEASLAALTPKYQSLEESAAESSYAADQKAEQDQENSDRTYNLDVAKFEQSSSNSNNSDLNTYLSQFKATARTGGGYGYTGPNGEAINLGQYASALSQGDDAQTLSTIRNQLTASTSSEDKQALAYLNTQVKKYGSNASAIVGAISNKSDYSNLFSGM